MDINYSKSASPELIERLITQLTAYEKLRVGYVDPGLSEEEKQEVKMEIEKSVIENMRLQKKTFLQKFFFSDYD